MNTIVRNVFRFCLVALLFQSSLQEETAEGIFRGKGGKGTKAPTKAPTLAPTESPTVSAAPSSCQDNPDRFPIPSLGENETRRCDWVTRQGPGVMKFRCNTYIEAAQNCRISCGTCPTDAPSFVPSDFPSPSPTTDPTATPSDLPTVTPSLPPTVEPTNMPSEAPSDDPTLSPSKFPSDIPSPSPSMIPTTAPTAAPTSHPSKSPSKRPTAAPSFRPTGSPTCISPSKGGKGKGCPTPEPSAAPTPCQDTAGTFTVTALGKTDASCEWVLKGGGPSFTGATPWRCNNFSEATDNCKQLCGECGCQDTAKRFFIADDPNSHSCEWVARKMTEARCALENVRFLCPATCGNCA